jgi:hypothetical protein
MDNHIEGGAILLQFFRETPDRLTVFKVQDCSLHPGIRRDGLIEQLFAATCNNHLIALRMESLGETTADPRASTGYHNCIAGYFHDVFSFIRTLSCTRTNGK